MGAAEVIESKVVAPTPHNPARNSGNFSQPRERSNSELERLGMGVRKLGFGQTIGAKAAPKKMGFGAIGKPVEEGTSSASFTSLNQTNNRSTDESNRYAREKFGTQKGISSDEFFGRGTFDSAAQAEARDDAVRGKARLRCEGTRRVPWRGS